jgi:intracellular septation protein
MKILFDLLSVILFFICYYTTGSIFIATAAAIAATFGQVIYCWIRHRKVDPMLWISLVLITVLGGATLIFQQKQFIYWKPTALYWIISLVLLLAKAIKRTNLIKKMMGAQMTLPDKIWNQLNIAWAIFFMIMGGLNLFIAFNFTESIWVNFKLFGTMGLMIVFVIGQTLLLSKYLQKTD